MRVTDLFLTKPPPARRPRARRRHAGRRVLRIEVLEDRCLWSYSITDLGTLGGMHSYAYAINNRGWVAGTSDLPCGCVSHPFLWANGALHDLGAFAGSTASDGYGINDLGQVVGGSGHAFLWSRETGLTDLGIAGHASSINNRSEVIGQMSPPSQAFLWKDGKVRPLGTLGGGSGPSIALGINNRREVVGQANALNYTHAFLWTESGGMQDLGSFDGTPGSTSGAAGINDLGQVVGDSYSQALGMTRAAYFSPSGVVDLGSLGGAASATGVNNSGQVVGDSYTPSGDDHAFLTDLFGGPMVDLNTLIPPDSGWTLIDARGINGAGQIVGYGRRPGYDIFHAYLLTPDAPPAVGFVALAPEPGSLGMVSEMVPSLEVRRSDVAALPGAAQLAEAGIGAPQGSWGPGSLWVLVVAAPEPALPGGPDPLSDALTQ